MKKRVVYFLILALTLFLSGCGNSAKTETAPPEQAAPKILVLSSEMVEEIRKEESFTSTNAALKMTFHDLQDLKLLKDEKTDNSSYTFTYQMTFDNGKSSNAKVIYRAIEDKEAEKGYTLDKSFSFK